MVPTCRDGGEIRLARLYSGVAPSHLSPIVSGVADVLIDVFISHASEDSDIAGALALLLQVALHLDPKRIRCTSVDGFRLKIGADTDEQLKLEVRASRVLIGLM